MARVGRRFFATKEGIIGTGPADLRKGDRVWVFSGADAPFILCERVDDSPTTDPRDILGFP